MDEFNSELDQKARAYEMAIQIMTPEVFIAAMREGHGPAQGQSVGEWIALEFVRAARAISST